MGSKVTCIVKVEPGQYDAVFSMLSGLGLKAFDAPQADPAAPDSNSKDAIGCYKIFHDRDLASALVLPSILQEIPGVKSVAQHYEYIEEPKTEIQPNTQQPLPLPWYKRLIPIGLSALVTFLTIALAIEHYRALLDPTDSVQIKPWTLALILGGPTAIVFTIQIIFKFFARENPHL